MDTETKKDPIVKRKIGNKYLQMQESHKLLEYYKECPFYDRALPRIAEKMKEIDGYLTVIDVGANIGDTVSLVTDKVDGSFLCIEGDEKYLPFLKINVQNIGNSKVVIEENYCGENVNGDKKLAIHRENGTSRLENSNENNKGENIKLKSLDKIIEENPSFKKANILKIDTDGFEINVLKSGAGFLKETKPIIYFEFDPEFYSINNKEPLYVFDFLFSLGYKEALFYDNFGVPINIIDVSNKNEIEKLVNLIDKKKIYYYDVLIFHSSKKEQYKEIFKTELFSSLSLFDVLLNEIRFDLGTEKDKNKAVEEQYNLTKIELNSIQSDLDTTIEELKKNKTQLDSKINELDSIYYSRGWKFVVFLRKMINYLIPKESLRRKVISVLYNFSKKFVKFILKMKGTSFGYFLRFKNYIIELKSRKKRKINLNSKKIVFIDHSFHLLTKSSLFLINYLKEFFEIEVIQDESWNGKLFPDLTFIDESYLGVIFFQLLPDNRIIKNIKNDNIIYFPMYDQSGRLGLDYWDNYRDLKIINFCKALHNKLNKSGFESIYIQYFPKPEKFIPGNMNEVFFWQRLSKISINTITKLFKNKKIKLHIHKAVDPGQEFIQPNKEEENKHQITYSDWFKTKEEMWDVIKQKGIYIAPREYEGIGMSFLEAMAMGKVVISINNPTMNEYIKDGENGYLFDLKHPKEIDLSNIEQIQRNTYEFMQNGYREWEKNKNRIIDFIKKE